MPTVEGAFVGAVGAFVAAPPMVEVGAGVGVTARGGGGAIVGFSVLGRQWPAIETRASRVRRVRGARARRGISRGGWGQQTYVWTYVWRWQGACGEEGAGKCADARGARAAAGA